jgi:hypothetical protein
MRQDRRSAYRRGHFAEFAAAALLCLKGYRLLARRYRTPLGEIDLIAKRGRLVAFVEVKARPTRARPWNPSGRPPNGGSSGLPISGSPVIPTRPGSTCATTWSW